jgi:hypothetical protein
MMSLIISFIGNLSNFLSSPLYFSIFFVSYVTNGSTLMKLTLIVPLTFIIAFVLQMQSVWNARRKRKSQKEQIDLFNSCKCLSEENDEDKCKVTKKKCSTEEKKCEVKGFSSSVFCRLTGAEKNKKK